MIFGERHYLQAELAALDELIDQLPMANVIDRMSLEARKKEVEAELSTQPSPYYEPARIRLTFHGKPVVKSHGILTEFAADALDTFADMVAAFGASQDVQLGMRGMIPNRDKYRLMVTGTALGSFGFELEEAPKDNNLLVPELSPTKAAIEQAKAIMESSIGSDDDLAEAISEAEPRAIDALRAFLQTMVEHSAVCTLVSDDKPFEFENVDQVKFARERLSQENIHEDDREIIGTFRGVLPTCRTFEFSVEESGDIILGKVGPKIEDASTINRVIEKPMMIRVHTKQVGMGKPSYILNEYEEITE